MIEAPLAAKTTAMGVERFTSWLHANREGLMIGLKLKVPPGKFAEAALERKLLLIPAGDSVVRVMPPLVVTDEETILTLEKTPAASSEWMSVWPVMAAVLSAM